MKKLINNISAYFFRKKNKNKDVTIIARDCVGGILYHQLGLKFLSPTINLFFIPEDFNYFCLHLKDYIDTEMVELKDDEHDYPIGVLSPTNHKPIKVHFLHYETYEEALNKWNERKQRINWNNIHVISTFCYYVETETLSEQLINDWNKIPYKKVVLTDKQYGFDNEFVIDRPKECKEFAWLLYTPGKTIIWKRTFNKYNFVKFLNK